MILRMVDYFEAFQCIAGDCKDTCCVGWELDIDEESFSNYKKVKGRFGERLRSFMVDGNDETGECNTFRLVGNRCPFLNEKNLCDIYTELGEKALCKVCREYPRFQLDFGNVRERGLSLSCEVVCDLLFSKKEKVSFLEKELKGVTSSEAGETFYMDELLSVRRRLLDVVWDRSRTISERLHRYLNYSERMQEAMNAEELALCMREDIEPLMDLEASEFFDEDGFYEEIFYLLEGLEVLDNEWENAYTELKQCFQKEEEHRLWKSIESNEDMRIWMEQILIYFSFRYLMKAVYDADLLSKVKFVAFSFLVIRMMLTVRYVKNGNINVEDIKDVCRIYSKEVEHSEENIAYLMEEFIFSDIFTIDNIRKGVLNVWINKE